MAVTTLVAPTWAPTLLETPEGVPQMGLEEVMARWENGPRLRWGCDRDAFFAYYVRPVTMFGMSVCQDAHPGGEAWSAARGAALPRSNRVELDLVRYSPQIQGVLTSVLATVVTNGAREAPCDPAGWFNNRYPVLMRWPDGSMSVRDGNHRVIGARLRGDRTIRAHVIDYHWAVPR